MIKKFLIQILLLSTVKQYALLRPLRFSALMYLYLDVIDVMHEKINILCIRMSPKAQNDLKCSNP